MQTDRSGANALYPDTHSATISCAKHLDLISVHKRHWFSASLSREVIAAKNRHLNISEDSDYCISSILQWEWLKVRNPM